MGFLPETLNMEEKFGLTLQMAHPLRAVPKCLELWTALALRRLVSRLALGILSPLFVSVLGIL
ncbi:unnamed protein product [Prunus armeniaca]|uniref:Uncharacterized protein n=1 Tax=Prunus armeniaca TaxID=36596 RepID=A0A6J5TK77_PRUAR|nr:unnamed protein product [Prunus armeniaca]